MLYSLEINCGPLDEPNNGFVSLSGTAEGDTATYRCKPGFVLEGEDTRVCNCSGNWTGSVPECRSTYTVNGSMHLHIFSRCQYSITWSMYICILSILGINCGPLDAPQNGFVSLSGTAVSDSATYSCKPGFVLEPEEGRTRVCNHSGNWTGSVPECRSMYIL